MTDHTADDARLVEAALALAVEKHHGQRDKSGQPYVLHPIQIMLRFSHAPARAVALLHDVIEDCGVTVDDLGAAERRVTQAGYKITLHGDYEPGRRFYFDGPDGVEYEVVSYA